ncbi:MAG: hypothetical protein GY869_16760 [Planctomycetes bacterium]|nr:hypothetical protein [Planctomycetota bacterium]
MKKYVLYALLIICVISYTSMTYAQINFVGPPRITPEMRLGPQIINLLNKIEARSNTLKTFQADMLFEQQQLLIETVTIRKGQTYYQADDKRVQFRIHFDNWLQKDLEEDITSLKPTVYDEDVVFDGMWLTLLNARTKSGRKQEISKTPHNKEAFRLGKGDIPLPFAIQKNDIIKEFDVKLVPTDPKKPDNFTEPASHLFLKPKTKSSFAEKYVSLELWISEKTTLPLRIRYRANDDEVTTVTWSKITADKSINPKTFQITTPAGWDMETVPLY